MQKNKQIKRIVVSAMMVALSILLCRVLGFSPPNNIFRVEIGFLPIVIVGFLFGPLWGMAAYGLSDLIGAALTTGVNFFITADKILIGLLFGLFFYRKRMTFPRVLLTLSLVAVVADVLLMAPIFVVYFGYTWPVAFWARTANALVNLPIRVALTYLTFRYADRFLKGSDMGFPLLRRPPLPEADSSVEQTPSLETTRADSPATEAHAAFRHYANSPQHIPRLGLDRMNRLMTLLGQPQRLGRYIHIAGTNGKGSVAAYIAAVLQTAGYRTGLYTSPNLLKVNERIVVDGQPVSDSDLNRLLACVERAANELSQAGGELPSQFEIWTAAAFLYFAERRCDYVVLETGLGGEFDATNIIEANEIAVLTKVDLDHMAYLGSTLTEIAATKCGILKDRCTTRSVVSAPQSDEVRAVIEAEAHRHELQVIFVEPPALREQVGMHEVLAYGGMQFLLPLAGIYQLENAVIAIEVARRLGISPSAIEAGIQKARHRGRFEVLSEDPLIIYDGGHNPGGIKALCASLDRYLPGRALCVVFACMADKDILPSLQLLAAPQRSFVFTTIPHNERAMTTDELAQKAVSIGIVGRTAPHLQAALEMAKATADTVLVCGSLYLYGELPPSLLSH